MIDAIRLATPDEVKSIAEHADITPQATVYAFGSDLAVVRPALEIDPLCMAPESNMKRRTLFIWGLENIARSTGNTQYYFNVKCSDEEWQSNIEKWGAQRTSVEPEFRYKKSL